MSTKSVKSEQSSVHENEGGKADGTGFDKDSVGGSTIAGANQKALAKRREKLLGKARGWLKTVKPKQVLDGVVGRECWQMRQTLEALQRMGDRSPDTVLLQAHVEVWSLAEDC